MSLDRWLLVSYAGFPYSANSLMPDNGLANLAGALIAEGKKVLILDYCTVDTIDRLTSSAMRKKLGRLWSKMNVMSKMSFLSKAFLFFQLHRSEVLREKRQGALTKQIIADISERIIRDGITAIGLKLWNGDGLKYSSLIARRIKQLYPAVKVFGGGPQIDYFMGLVLERNPWFDALVYGEGEATIRLLAQKGDDPKSYPDIANLIFAYDGQVRTTKCQFIANLDELPMPVYDPDIYLALRNDNKVKIVVIDESRGCKNNCAFCIHPVKSNRQIRVKSIRRLMREVDNLQERYGINTFRFAGSCTPYSLLNGFAQEIIRQKKSVAYASFAHINQGNEMDFKTIRASGCLALFFGIESGAGSVLAKMRKRTTPTMIRETIHAAKKAGIFSVGSLIFPAPGDDETTEAETLDLLRQTMPDAAPVMFPGVTPRTDWYDHAEEYGFNIPNLNKYTDKMLEIRVKMIVPPQFWGDLPLRLNGKKYSWVLAKTMAFIVKLEKLGIPTNIPDDIYLMSSRINWDVVDFRNRTRAALFVGDAAQVQQIVSQINRRIVKALCCS
jgi:hypothetical protein